MITNFEDFLKAKEALKKVTPTVNETEETKESDKEIVAEAVVIDASTMRSEQIPLISFEDSDVYKELDMYRKVDPAFANSVMAWD